MLFRSVFAYIVMSSDPFGDNGLSGVNISLQLVKANAHNMVSIEHIKFFIIV